MAANNYDCGILRRISLVVMTALTFLAVATHGANETEVLLKFKSLLSNTSAIDNWLGPSLPCNGNSSNWKGVRCNDDGTTFGLKLERMGLTGMIDIDSLLQLPNLRTLSFMYNNFDGPLPDVKKLTALKVLYLSYNRFNGEIRDDAFESMDALKVLHLARNEFSGPIPRSIVVLPRLQELSLEGNRFDGRIPEFPQKGITVVNLANNLFEGRIPSSLSKMSSTFFTGNFL